MINKIFNTFFYLLLFLTIFICTFFIPTYSTSSNPSIINFTDTGFLLWPAPGISKINSNFGKRTAPTTGASSYHKGIDIGCPEGFEFVAVTDGTITFVGFLGGGGYTITLTDSNVQNGEFKYSYCHCNPNFIVHVGDKVVKGQIIGKVGPKYVDNVPRKHLYRQHSEDKQMEPQRGPHLHFGIRINNEYVNPLDYLSIPNIGTN